MGVLDPHSTFRVVARLGVETALYLPCIVELDRRDFIKSKENAKGRHRPAPGVQGSNEHPGPRVWGQNRVGCVKLAAFNCPMAWKTGNSKA